MIPPLPPADPPSLTVTPAPLYPRATNQVPLTMANRTQLLGEDGTLADEADGGGAREGHSGYAATSEEVRESDHAQKRGDDGDRLKALVGIGLLQRSSTDLALIAVSRCACHGKRYGAAYNDSALIVIHVCSRPPRHSPTRQRRRSRPNTIPNPPVDIEDNPTS
jgi:hypothetical protein